MLLEAARQAGLPVARACGGTALCAGCALRILSGGASLEAESQQESEVKRRNRVPDALRLSCCARVRGDVEVTATYW